jgi:hypothetical protein
MPVVEFSPRPRSPGSDQSGEDPGRSVAADLAGGVTSATNEPSADAPTAPPPAAIVSSRGGRERSAYQIGTVIAVTRPATAHESAVRATIAAAYDLAAQSGSISIRSRDLLRQLHRSASVLREATARVEKEAPTQPDPAAAGEALALLHEVGRIGLFYEGYVQ